ncbi:MAG: alkaline phosphatase D family protein [Gammaproteobacteria bacterium]|nr:alkaline phosphatase D family protein [Gammaproteobacteria bacterium]
MSNLRSPGLGPIIGHTTDHSCCIWIRAAVSGDEGAVLASENRTLGVIAITHENKKKIKVPEVYYFRLKREFDRTGIFNLGVDVGIGNKGTDASPSLEPDTEYIVKVGTLTVDDPFPDDESIPSENISNFLPNSRVWLDALVNLNGQHTTATFRTFPTGNADQPLSFILGSCRYPGLLWKVKEADRIFSPVRRIALNGYNSEQHNWNHSTISLDSCRFTLMVGDQIYADLLNRFIPLGRADSYSEFQERYLTAFGSPNMKRLLASVPNYMILDDHEIEDNWTQDRVKKSDKRTLFNMAINSYMSYQWSHSPRTFGRRLYYNFDCAGYPFFVLDTRTQRFINQIKNDDRDNHMLGRPSLSTEDEPGQLERLLEWLQKQQDNIGDAPKFIVTSSVFTPNPISARTNMDVAEREASDSWPGFPNTRKEILKCIIKHKIQNVIFLSGDIHCANVAKMRFNGSVAAEKLKSFSITSSAFYWPFPFADGEPSDYVHNSTAKNQKDTFKIERGLTMDYTAEGFTQDDNFCHISIDKASHKIKVTAFNKVGEIICKTGRDGIERPLITTLDLAQW